MKLEKIYNYIWFTETHRPYQPQKTITSYLGSHNNAEYYLIYEKNSLTTLDHESLRKHVRKNAVRYIIYADNCTLSENYMRLHNISFKKIPRNFVLSQNIF